MKKVSLAIVVSTLISVSLFKIFASEQPIDTVVDYGKSLIGKPYYFQIDSSHVLDDAGFIAHIFEKYPLTLPCTRSELATLVIPVDFNELRPGDLFFFKNRQSRSNEITHVAIVSGRTAKKMTIIHSTARGVVEETHLLSYYKRRLVRAGHIAYESKDVNLDLIDSLKTVDSLRQDTLEQGDSILTVIGVGDMMIGSNFPSPDYLPPFDGQKAFAGVDSILKDAHVTYGNLEGSFLTADSATTKKCANASNCYAFKMPDHYAQYFRDAGFDVVGIANNHVGDFGNAGRKNTATVLSSTGINFAGLTASQSTMFTIDGITYGFAAFAPNIGTMSINDTTTAKLITAQLNEVCDVVIIAFHGGAEGDAYRNITRENEIYLGENRGNPYQFARAVINAGADIVFGSGPHVTRAVDLYRDRFIAYSLGNFATYGRFSLKGVKGVAPIVKVSVDRTGKFLKADIISTMQPGANGGPAIDPDNRALTEIINLTKSDIPEAPLTISPTGEILPSEK